jgi:hypothetical protein
MNTNLRMGNLLVILLVGGALAACTSQAVSSGTGGSGGSGPATGTGGTSSAGGANANGVVCHPENNTTTNLAASAGIACPKPAASGVIADFTFPADAGVPDGGAPARFGDDSTVLSGGGSTFANTGGMISQDSSQGDWHLQGTVGNYAGFSLYFDDIPNASEGNMPCNMIDATGFTGIQFTIWGSTAGNGITMSMGIVDDTPTASWFQSIGVSLSAPLPAGACIPKAAGMQYYHPGCGDPTAAAINIPTSATSAATAQTVTLKWTDFVSGDCQANVIPNQIVSMAWAFAWGGTTGPTVPYAVDIHIDNLKFITN